MTDIKIIGILYSYHFSVGDLRPQNSVFRKAFVIVPESCRREFRAVASS